MTALYDRPEVFLPHSCVHGERVCERCGLRTDKSVAREALERIKEGE